MRKFTKGVFEIEKNVKDLEEYERKIDEHTDNIIQWADTHGIGIRFGTNDKDTYLCEFKIVANTKNLCDGYVSELKEMLKNICKTPKILYRANGNCV